MIIKSFEISKINLDLNNLFLFYGKNNGFKDEFAKKIIKNKYNTINYDEKEILENKDNFIENLLTKSLFDKQKIRYFETLLTSFIFRSFKKLAKLRETLNLKFLFLTITFLIFLYLIFLSSDCLTISTSGNSGI